MAFTENAVNRDTIGRFSHKVGSPAEVSLSSVARPRRVPRGYAEAPDEMSTESYKAFGLDNDDASRIEDFVRKSNFVVFAKPVKDGVHTGTFYKVKYKAADGTLVDAGTLVGQSGPTKTVAYLVRSARKHRNSPDEHSPHVREMDRKNDQLARAVLGDDYERMVAPPEKQEPSFLERLFGR